MVKSSTVRMNTWDGIYVSKGLALSLFRGNRLCLGVDATGRWRGGQLGGGVYSFPYFEVNPSVV